MANLTKTQIKANLNKLWDKEELGKLNGAIDNAIDVVDSMINDVEEERDSIERYECEWAILIDPKEVEDNGN